MLGRFALGTSACPHWVSRACGTRLFVLSLFFWVAGTGVAHAGINVWPSNGPEGGYIRPLAINPTDPATVYAGASRGGVFQSTDAGASWTAANSGLTNTVVLALAIDPTTPTTLYAGTEGGVFKSTDGAGSWTAASSGLTNTVILALAIDLTTSTTLYAGTNGGVFKSTNGGGTWSPMNTGLTDLG